MAAPINAITFIKLKNAIRDCPFSAYILEGVSGVFVFKLFCNSLNLIKALLEYMDTAITKIKLASSEYFAALASQSVLWLESVVSHNLS